MTSQERHEARYQRRKAKREEKLKAFSEKSFNQVFNYENLITAGLKCCNGVRWKASVLLFENNIIKKAIDIEKELDGETPRRFKEFNSFVTVEHGKARDIDAIPIWDRTQQKCFNTNYLYPLYTRSFIKDNAASIKNGGTEFTLKRLKKKLRAHFRKYGQEGGILLFDFKGYFRSILHSKIKERAEKRMSDSSLRRIFFQWIDDFNKLKNSLKPGRGIGLGSEVSQTIALDFLSPVDHYFTDHLGLSGYARYMDDGYIISNDLNLLKRCLEDLVKLSEELGLTLSLNKCRIIPFKDSKFFTFLKFRVCLKETGKIVVLPNKRASCRERSRLRKIRIKVIEGILTVGDAWNSVVAWIAHIKQCTSYKFKVFSTHKYFQKIFAGYLI